MGLCLPTSGLKDQIYGAASIAPSSFRSVVSPLISSSSWLVPTKIWAGSAFFFSWVSSLPFSLFWFTNAVAKQRTVLRPEIFQEFELKEKTVLSHNVARYRFHLPTTDAVLGLPIGQHMSVGAFIRQPDGSVKEIVRSYTPLTGDEVRGYFELLIKSYPQGNISQHFASLKIGQQIRVRGPKGAFVYSPNMVRRFGMIAGGTGITPMMQVMRAIQRGRRDGDKTEVDLIFANLAAEDILLKEDLDALALQDPRIHVPTGWKGGIGFVTPEMIKMWLPEPARDIKILCGPPPMVAAMKKAAVSLRYEKARLVSKIEDQVFVF